MTARTRALTRAPRALTPTQVRRRLNRIAVAVAALRVGLRPRAVLDLGEVRPAVFDLLCDALGVDEMAVSTQVELGPWTMILGAIRIRVSVKRP